MRRPLILLLLCALVLSGCSVSGEASGPPQLRVEADDEEGLEKLGFPSTASKNTTRVGGGDAAADAAGVANAVFPSTSPQTRPAAVLIVGSEDWQGGVAAAALAASPIRAPILLSEDGELPPISADTLDRLDPRGAELAKGTQVIRVGDAANPDGERRTAHLRGSGSYETAAAIDAFNIKTKGEPSDNVVIASGERPEFAMPAAAWAAHSGDAVLFSPRDRLPAATRNALRQHEKPRIWILGPSSVISPGVEAELKALGTVKRVAGETPVQNAVEFSRFKDGGFGWGIKVPGYNFTLASTTRPMDAASSAALATNGVFAPLLLTDDPQRVPFALESYLLDIQPGYEDDPREGVYNRVWVLGDETTISPAVQGRLDELTELIPVEKPKKGS